MRAIRGIQDLGLFRVIGQPNLNLIVDRQKAARYQINVADVQDAIQTAVGGNAVSQVLQGEQRYDLVMRYLPEYRDTQGGDREDSPAVALRRTRLAGPALQDRRCWTAPRRSIAKATPATWQSSTACAAATWAAPSKRPSKRSEQQVKLPEGYTHRLGRRIRQPAALAKAADDRAAYHDPGDLHHSLHHVPLLQVGLAHARQYRHGARWAGLLALLLTGTHFSVSSGVGFLALFGVCVQTGVIMLEYINQLRARGHTSCGRGGGRRGVPASPHHDDHAGGDSRAAAGGPLTRDRLGFAAARSPSSSWAD